jgi:P27 family predicted phage terminase small subunit
MAEELDAVGVLSELDARRLNCWLRHIPNTGTTAKHWRGYSEDDATKENGDCMIKAHPAAIMKADAWKRLRAMLAEFGMTPASRSKVSIKSLMRG